MKSSILFLIFNRPDTTEQVFETIRQARPPRLYVAADGPRSNKIGEKELCNRTRSIVGNVDWPCEVHTLFRDENLGCGIAVCDAINWFFSNEDEGIILEDDILPHPDFFVFCDELLEKYRYDSSVGAISGHNLLYKDFRNPESYGFMAVGHIWGWASWKRSWKDFEYVPSKKYSFAHFKKALETTFPNRRQRKYWENIYKKVEFGVNHIWDYQWTISLICMKKLSVVPFVNLTKNIGFSENSTHTSSASEEELNVITSPILPIIHPKTVKQSMDAEELERINSKMYFTVKGEMKRIIKQCYTYLIKHVK